MDVGEKMKIALETRKMSQKELAKNAHTTEASISRYIKGERYPKWQIAKRIANILGVSLDWLADRDTNDDAISAYWKGWNDAISSVAQAIAVKKREYQVAQGFSTADTPQTEVIACPLQEENAEYYKWLYEDTPRTDLSTEEFVEGMKNLKIEVTDCSWK